MKSNIRLNYMDVNEHDEDFIYKLVNMQGNTLVALININSDYLIKLLERGINPNVIIKYGLPKLSSNYIEYLKVIDKMSDINKNTTVLSLISPVPIDEKELLDTEEYYKYIRKFIEKKPLMYFMLLPGIIDDLNLDQNIIDSAVSELDNLLIQNTKDIRDQILGKLILSKYDRFWFISKVANPNIKYLKDDYFLKMISDTKTEFKDEVLLRLRLS